MLYNLGDIKKVKVLLGGKIENKAKIKDGRNFKKTFREKIKM